jgi:hypothetical protein
MPKNAFHVEAFHVEREYRDCLPEKAMMTEDPVLVQDLVFTHAECYL